ncbi:cell division protein FtsK [Listeria costaricensis]|uniref:cell division protein FtsK n=1 Tax=Listeria costaricensis TaxID=2026604 RepID=UPI000C077DC9|nr:cell division protein FtsK [Listeria costaricensis]
MIQFIEKHFFKYKGRRIRYRTKDAIKRVGMIIFIPTFLLLLFLLLKLVDPFPTWTASIDYFKQIDYITIAEMIFLSACLAGIVLILCKVIFYNQYIFLKHKQIIARLIVGAGQFEKETVQKESTFDWTWDGTGGKTKSVEKVSFFPRVYYRVKDNYLYIRFPVSQGKHQDQFLNMAPTLATALYAELDAEYMEEGYICYKFLYAISRDRLNIQELSSSKGKLPLMKRAIWEFDKLPHMLLCGGTGAGKTYTILSVVLGLLRGACKKEDIIICDPKNADLADLEGVFPSVYSKKAGIEKAVREFKDDMLKRSEEMKNMENYRTGQNYRALGLPPKFLVFDEFVAFMEMLDFKEQQELLSNLKQVVMLGRQAGYFMIVGLQRPDAKYLGDGIRDQFHFRIALGRNSDIGYSMMFGENNKKFTFKDVRGFGYVDSGKGVISEFYSPFVPADFDFMEVFKEAI